jgi:uncharacterized protein (DUF2132 family)
MSQENEQLNNPLHGLKLDTLLNELVTHYGFDILAEYTRLHCFKNNPSIISSLKFLRKTEWAREKLERFYLYNYKNLPEPGEEEFEIPTRQRIIPLHHQPKAPKKLNRGEAPVVLAKESFKETHRSRPEKSKYAVEQRDQSPSNNKRHAKPSRAVNHTNENKPFDPYANAPK